MTKFTHLHTHSHYSLLDGLAKIDQLVNHAKELGMDSLALTDHGNLYGAIEFYKTARAAGIKPVLGVESYIMPDVGSAEKYFHMILLCENETGWKNLLKLMTHAQLEGYYYKPRINKDFLRQHHEGIIALSACISGEVGRNLVNGNYDAAKKAALEYQDIFGKNNFFLELGRHPGIPEVTKTEKGILQISKETGIPIAATQDIHYLKKEDQDYHEILLAVQTGGKLDDPDRLSLKDDDFSMTSPERMAELFADLPEAVSNTQAIADRCNVTIELNKIQLPKFPLPAEALAKDGVPATSISYLREIINRRITARYPEINQVVKDRLEFELGVIEKMGFADYFLIVQDLVNWAKDRGIVVGPGRGSAAGSIVAYILRVTDIDPIKYELLFERFLNPDRIQMPDIDIDITDKRRDEVYGYIVEKYGPDHVAHIITFGTMAARAAIRDVGRALDISYAFCDQLAKLIPFGQDLEEALQSNLELSTLYKTNDDAKRILNAAKKMEGIARHASTHACGIVISAKPLTDYLPLQKAPQDPDTIVTQFEMHGVEDLGLLKMDLLGLKNLTIMEDTVRLIKDNKGEKIEIDHLPEWDAKTEKLLQAADTTGVFQFESSGMRRYMKEIVPKDLEALIALVALYRPGPMDLIPEYLRRRHGLEKVTYLHPKLEPILKPTWGVGIYQEQMMRIARDLAGFTLAEADTLRKAIGKKIRELLDKQKEKLIAGMIKNGIAPGTAQAIWDLFPPFARYGFNRSHAACYAMIGYQTAYLKAHYPVELMASVLNADSGDTERASFLISECQKMGISVLPPDINKSSLRFTPEDNNIRFGLAGVKNVGENIILAIIEERQKSGAFKNLADLVSRVQHKDLNKKSLESMAKCGVLDSLGLERNLIIQNMEDIVKFHQALKKSHDTNSLSLFGKIPINYNLKLKATPPATSAEKLLWEKELLGLYVSDHPMNAHKEKLKKMRAIPIKDALLVTNPALRLVIGGMISTIKKIVTKKGQPMLFATIEDTNGTLEVIVFSNMLEKTATVWEENKAVLIAGKMSDRNGETKLIVDKAVAL